MADCVDTVFYHIARKPKPLPIPRQPDEGPIQGHIGSHGAAAVNVNIQGLVSRLDRGGHAKQSGAVADRPKHRAGEIYIIHTEPANIAVQQNEPPRQEFCHNPATINGAEKDALPEELPIPLKSTSVPSQRVRPPA